MCCEEFCPVVPSKTKSILIVAQVSACIVAPRSLFSADYLLPTNTKRSKGYKKKTLRVKNEFLRRTAVEFCGYLFIFGIRA